MLKPILDNILVREDKKQEAYGSIIIPEHLREDVNFGTVVAVGPGRITAKGVRIPPAVKVGDRLMYGKITGTYVRDNGEQLLCLAEEHAWAVIEGAAA